MAQIQGAAEPAQCRGGSWFFDLPPNSDPTDRRRSEVWLRRSNGSDRYHDGEVTTVDLQLRPSLGAAARTDDDWHLLWQLHGPIAGEWGAPAIAAVVRQGAWYLSGGSGHPDQAPGVHDYTWEIRLGPFTDGAWHRLRLKALLSTDPQLGSVDVQLNDGAAVQGYHPRTSQGLQPGTMYPQQEYLACRVGIYRGTLNGAKPPTHRQSVEVRDVSLT